MYKDINKKDIEEELVEKLEEQERWKKKSMKKVIREKNNEIHFQEQND